MFVLCNCNSAAVCPTADNYLMMSNTKISMKLICMLQLPLCIYFFSLLLSKHNFFVFCLEDTDWSRHTDWQMIQTGEPRLEFPANSCCSSRRVKRQIGWLLNRTHFK